MRQDDETDQQEQICTCRESRHRCTCFAAYKAQVVLIEKENKQTIWVRMVFGVQKNEAKGKEHYHCLPKSEGHRRNLPQVRHSPMKKNCILNRNAIMRDTHSIAGRWAIGREFRWHTNALREVHHIQTRNRDSILFPGFRENPSEKQARTWTYPTRTTMGTRTRGTDCGPWC